jgi:glutaredoxin 3
MTDSRDTPTDPRDTLVGDADHGGLAPRPAGARGAGPDARDVEDAAGGGPRIVVYTTDRCPYCMRAKRLLDSKGLRYEEINLGRDPDGRMQLATKTGMMTFPQILVDGTLVGGFEETAAAAATGRLDELLAV